MAKVTVYHEKGQKHGSKTDWPKVVRTHSPVVDEENPELVNDPTKKFYKQKKDK